MLIYQPFRSIICNDSSEHSSGCSGQENLGLIYKGLRQYIRNEQLRNLMAGKIPQVQEM
jgi:hypothetical protein